MKHPIELSGTELKTALTGLGRVIPRSNSLPVLQHLKIQRSDTGLVTLQAMDLDTQVSYELEERQQGEAMTFLVPFEPLQKAAKGNPQSLELFNESATQVKLRIYLKGTPLEQTLTSPPVSEMLPPLARFEAPLVVLDGNFREAIRQALDCCSEDTSRPVLHNVCLDVSDPKAHYVVATDGRHLFSANSFAFDLKESVLVPNHRFLHWNGFMAGGNATLALKAKTKKEPAWMQIVSGAWTFSAKQMEGQYPQWKSVVPETNQPRTTIRLPETAVEMILSAIPQLPGNDLPNKPITLEVSARELKLKARGKDQNEWTVVPISGIPINGKPVSVTLNRELLVKALRFGLTSIAILDELSVVEFLDQGRRMLVMPVRPDPVTTTKPAQPAAPPRQQQPPEPNPQPNHPPPATKLETPNEERKVMPRSTTPAPTTTPNEANETSPVKQVMQQVETLKDTLKGVLRDLAETLDLLKQVEKEKKASDKEIEAVREKLDEVRAIRI